MKTGSHQTYFQGYPRGVTLMSLLYRLQIHHYRISSPKTPHILPNRIQTRSEAIPDLSQDVRSFILVIYSNCQSGSVTSPLSIVYTLVVTSFFGSVCIIWCEVKRRSHDGCPLLSKSFYKETKVTERRVLDSIT